MCLQSANAANLLVNGGLELPACPGSVCGFVTPTGWGSNGDIDIVTSSLWQPQEGNQSLDLNATGNGTLFQSFSTTPGALYLVSFYLSGNPGNLPTIKSLDVSVASVSNSYTFDITGHTVAAMGWTQKTFQFTATGSTSTLLFASTDSPASNAGPALDNISVEFLRGPVSGVPEPSSIAMMLGSAIALGVARLRRRVG